MPESAAGTIADSKKHSYYDRICRDSRGNDVLAKNAAQEALSHSIFNNDVTFATGSAGTGKTFIAIACAVKLLFKKEIEKIVLLRPPVETGKSIGFLPGDFHEKFAPYQQPFMDSLSQLVQKEKLKQFLGDGTIEMMPLTFMRGSTQSNFTILDEAQNCTKEEMEMFITRLGEGGKYVITGDGSQSDLRSGQTGFDHAIKILGHIQGIKVVQFTEDDIVRHRIVKEAILAYKKDREKPFRLQGVIHNHGREVD